MDCRQVRELLSAYIDGELPESPLDSDAQFSQVKTHLSICPECAKEYEQLAAVAGLVKRLEPVPAPSQLTEQTMVLIRHHQRQRQSARWRAWWPAAAIAACLLLVVTVGGLKLMTPPMMATTPMVAESSGPLRQRMDGAEVAAPTAPAEPEAPRSAAGQWSDSVSDAYERKIIRTAELEVRTEEFDNTYRRVGFLVESEGGYVQSSTLWTNTENGVNYRGANFQVRVPAAAHARILEEFRRFGDVVRESESGRDVTGEYYDTSARLRNLTQQEERLLSILGKAVTIDEILRAEQELERIREEIEVLTGRVRYLEHLTEMTTINLTVTEPRPEEGDEPPYSLWERIVEAFCNSLERLGDLCEWLVLTVVSLWPLIIIVLVAAWYFLKWRRKR